jgi:hypothetical protein
MDSHLVVIDGNGRAVNGMKTGFACKDVWGILWFIPGPGKGLDVKIVHHLIS